MNTIHKSCEKQSVSMDNAFKHSQKIHHVCTATLFISDKHVNTHLGDLIQNIQWNDNVC